MRRGKLKHVLTFKTPSATTSDGEQRQPSGWTTVQFDGSDLSIPAQFVPKLSKEEYRNAEQKSKAPALFRFSYQPEIAAIDTKWRVNDGSDDWDVVGVVWSGNTNDDVEIQCTRLGHR